MRGSFRIGLLMLVAFRGFGLNAQVPIPVVHTWGDLQNAPKITLTPSHPTDEAKDLPAAVPVTFQVGVSGDVAVTNSAVVLYFLGETGSEHAYTPEEWGVYWLQIDGQRWVANTNTLTFARGETRPPGTLFYAQSICFQTAGDHVLELIKPFLSDDPKPEAGSKALARITIHVQDLPNALWYPLWTTQDVSGGAASGRNADGTQFATESVFNPKGDPAVPYPPRPKWHTEFPAKDQALPGLYQELGIYKQVPLKMNDGTLVVNFTPKMEGFFPDDYFLTRWWVNGELVHLNPKAERPGQIRLLGFKQQKPFIQSVAFRPFAQWPSLLLDAQIWYTQEVHFNLSFKPEWLGAKKGDRISTQFLYCPHGFMLSRRPVAPFECGAEFPGTDFSLASFSQMSNQVDFIYSGDPQHPQK